MSWEEMETKTGKPVAMTPTKEQALEAEKALSMPVVVKEASRGTRPFEPVHPQAVRSPGIYEGEFIVKDGDLIFHFWPHGFHEAQRRGIATPRFGPSFDTSLKSVMRSVFNDHRVEVSYDGDMGAWFARAKGWAENQFHFDLSVEACTKLHKALGGADS